MDVMGGAPLSGVTLDNEIRQVRRYCINAGRKIAAALGGVAIKVLQGD